MDVPNPMIWLRWTCLAVFLSGLVNMGCGPSDPSKDPAAAPAIKARADKIEDLKNKAARSKKR